MMSRFRNVCLILITVLWLGGCAQIFATNEPQPILVTLPAQTPAPTSSTLTPATAEVSQSEEATIPIAPVQPSTPASGTQVVPPTPPPQGAGIGATQKLWEWSETARPSAAAASTARLGVIVADGRFAWVNADSGQVESSAFLWSGILQGESWGEIYVDGLGTLAAAAIREQSIDEQTGLADSRARLAIYDAQAKEVWGLPELGSQHFYSAVLTSVSVIVGKWPQGFDDNTLAAYELYTGQKQWEIGGKKSKDAKVGYQQILQDGNRIYVLLNGDDSGAVAAFDLRTGEELWRWSDPDMLRPDLMSLSTNNLYVVSVSGIVAVNPLNGHLNWKVKNELHIAPEAGIASRQDFVYLAPSPAAELGFRPGLISLKADGSGLGWHSLGGLLAEPVTADEQAVWTIVKDYDSGNVWLSGLDPITGLEQVRLPVGTDPQTLYQVVPYSRRVYVLGDSLVAFGY